MIREECLIKNASEEEFLTPGKGGVSKDISRLTDRSLVDLGVVDDKLNTKHLEKETQNRVKVIEEARKDGFARKGSKVGNFTRFLYCLYKLTNPFWQSGATLKVRSLKR